MAMMDAGTYFSLELTISVFQFLKMVGLKRLILRNSYQNIQPECGLTAIHVFLFLDRLQSVEKEEET